MADLIGIEVSNEIYGLQDETARAAADSAESKAENAATSVASLEESLEATIAAVIKKYSPTKTLLWTNPSGGEQSDDVVISVPNLASYDRLEFYVENGVLPQGVQEIKTLEIHPENMSSVSFMSSAYWSIPQGGFLLSRQVTINTTANTITIGQNVAWNLYGNLLEAMDYNNYLQSVIKIYGVKDGAALPA